MLQGRLGYGKVGLGTHLSTLASNISHIPPNTVLPLRFASTLVHLHTRPTFLSCNTFCLMMPSNSMCLQQSNKWHMKKKNPVDIALFNPHRLQQTSPVELYTLCLGRFIGKNPCWHFDWKLKFTRKSLLFSPVDYPVIIGFEPLVNQRLLPPTFPRYTRLRTRKEAMLYLEEMVGRLRHITKITHCTGFHSALVCFIFL